MSTINRLLSVFTRFNTFTQKSIAPDIKFTAKELKAFKAEKNILLHTNLPFEFKLYTGFEDEINSGGIENDNLNTFEPKHGIEKVSDKKFEVKFVEIDDGNYINTLSIENVYGSPLEFKGTDIAESTNAKHLVIAHGYGNGIGFYFKNYEGLSKLENTNIYAIDWLGMGRSSRPAFNLHKLPYEESVDKIEDYFVTMLEKWRIKMKIEKFVLLGHSFGGYMSSLYALRYPERVEKLILESPVGIPKSPPYIEEYVKTKKLPKVTVDEESFVKGTFLKTELGKTFKKPSFYDDMDEYQRAKYYRISSFANKHTILLPFMVRTWERHYSVQSLIRKLGFLGEKLLYRYVSAFRNLNEQERIDLSKYMHSISILPGSSEYSICVLLNPGTYARKPLIDRIDKLEVPTTFMYGEHDWMDIKSGIDVSKKIKAPTGFVIIPDAGHNMHLDNPQRFNEAVKSIVDSQL